MRATDKLLKEIGAVREAVSGRQNVKYRLPNGAMFVRAHEPSGRTALNQYKILLRLLNMPGIPVAE